MFNRTFTYNRKLRLCSFRQSRDFCPGLREFFSTTGITLESGQPDLLCSGPTGFRFFLSEHSMFDMTTSNLLDHRLAEHGSIKKNKMSSNKISLATEKKV